MKKIGLIGGVGWPSTVDYYHIINGLSNREFRSLESPEILIYSLNFEPLRKLQYENRWPETTIILGNAARSLEKAGADFILICSVTTNIPCDDVQKFVKIPVISIADPVAHEIQRNHLDVVALLGTKATMEHPFFASKLAQYGIKVIVPERDERTVIHDIIYDELCHNIVRPESKKKYLDIVHSLLYRGALGVILGCTEIPMLISPDDLSVPVFDVTRLHAEEAFRLARSSKT